MTPPSSADAPTLLILAILVLLVVRRAISTTRGARVSGPRLAAFAALVVVLFVLTVLAGLTILPWYSAPLDAGVAVAMAAAGATYAVRNAQITETGPGEWTYRLRPFVSIVYILLFVIRLTIDLFVLNINPYGGSLVPTNVSAGTVDLIVIVDALFALSTGLVVGQRIGVYVAYRKARDAQAAPLR